MSRVVLTMAMSLDGFITGPQGDVRNPSGVGGMRLMAWLGESGEGDGTNGVEEYRPSDLASRLASDEMSATGGVITGKRTRGLCPRRDHAADLRAPGLGRELDQEHR